MQKSYITWYALLLMLVTLAGCSDSSDEHATESSLTTVEAIDKITIGYSRLRISLPIFVAKEKGLFEKHGLEASLLMYDTAQPLIRALIAGNIDVGGYAALPITYNGINKSGTELLFLTTMIEDENHRISYLLVKSTQPGRERVIADISDLRGKTIGILPTVAYEGWIEEILRRNGIDPSTEVNITPIDSANQASILKHGGVDALFTNDPAATSAIQSGAAELLAPGTVEVPLYIENPFPFGSFNVRREWADNNPKALEKLKAALNEAVDFVNKQPVEAKLSMVPYLPDQFGEDVEHYPNAKYLSTQKSNPQEFQDIADKYYQMKIISAPINVLEFVVVD